MMKQSTLFEIKDKQVNQLEVCKVELFSLQEDIERIMNHINMQQDVLKEQLEVDKNTLVIIYSKMDSVQDALHEHIEKVREQLLDLDPDYMSEAEKELSLFISKNK